MDEETGEVIVKLVNATAESRDVQVNLDGFGDIDEIARVITLSGENPDDENSLDEPMKIAPVESIFEEAANEVAYAVRPWSVTVLRMKSR